MIRPKIAIQQSILALLRGDVSIRFLADRHGVREAQIEEWRDIFLIAGILALDQSTGQSESAAASPKLSDDEAGGLGDPTTTPMPMHRLIPATTHIPAS